MSTDNPIAPSIGVHCGACQQNNKPDARYCKGCGQPLYEKCSECPHDVLLTDKFCDSCGTDLEASREALRQKHREWMSDAVAAAREYRFDRALRLLGRVTETDDYRFADQVNQAKQAIEKVNGLQSQAQENVNDVLVRAKQAYDTGNQPLTAKLLAAIPEPMMTPDVKKLLEKVQIFSNQLLGLDQELRAAIAEKNWPLVGGLVDQLLNLTPDDAGYQQVASQVAEKLLAIARQLLAKGRYGAAVETLESVPEVSHDGTFKQLRDRADDLHWLSSQFECEPIVTPMLGRLAIRFAKEVPEDQKAQKLVKDLATQLRQGPRDPRTHFPAWHASSECAFGGRARFLTAPQSLDLSDHAVIKASPGRFYVAIGLALQGLGLGRLDDHFAKKKGLLGGLSRRKNRVWGIDLGNASIKAICLQEIDGKPTVVDAFLQDYEAPLCRVGKEDEQREMLGRAVAAFLEAKADGMEGASLWANLPASKLISRFVRLPPVKDKQAAALLDQEINQKIPIPLDELATVRWIAALNDEEVHGRPAVITAARRRVVEDRLEQLKGLGLEVDGLQSDNLALVNFVAHEFAEDLVEPSDEVGRDQTPSVLLIDAGASATNVVVVSREAHWVWTMEAGGEDMTALVARPTKTTLGEAEKLKRNPADLPHPGKHYALVEQRQDEVRARVEAAIQDGMQQNKRFRVVQSFCCGGACLSHAWLRRMMLAQK